MADDDRDQRLLAELKIQLDRSRQQQTRLKDALTRVLSLIDRDQGP